MNQKQFKIIAEVVAKNTQAIDTLGKKIDATTQAQTKSAQATEKQGKATSRSATATRREQQATDRANRSKKQHAQTSGQQTQASGGLNRVLMTTATRIALVVAGYVSLKKAMDVGASGTRYNAMLEQTNKQFELLLPGARGIVDELIEFANVTPELTASVLASGRQLAAFGTDAANLEKELRMLSDISSGVGMSLREMSFLFGTFRVQNMIYTQDLNQMTQRGIPVLQELAAIMGRNVEEVRQLASEGQITFPMVEQAFINLTKEGGRFHNMTDEMSRTAIGLFSTLVSKTTELSGALMDLSFEPMKAGLEESINLVSKLTERLQIYNWAYRTNSRLSEETERLEQQAFRNMGVPTKRSEQRKFLNDPENARKHRAEVLRLRLLEFEAEQAAARQAAEALRIERERQAAEAERERIKNRQNAITKAQHEADNEHALTIAELELQALDTADRILAFEQQRLALKATFEELAADESKSVNEVAAAYDAMLEKTRQIAALRQELEDTAEKAAEKEGKKKDGSSDSTVPTGFDLTTIGGGIEQFASRMEALGETGRLVSEALTGTFRSINDELTRAIVQTGNWNEALLNIRTTLASAVVSAIIQVIQTWIAQRIAAWAVEKGILAATIPAQAAVGAATAATAGSVGAAWTPAAIAASIATLGGAAGIGVGAYTAALGAGTLATGVASFASGFLNTGLGLTGSAAGAATVGAAGGNPGYRNGGLPPLHVKTIDINEEGLREFVTNGRSTQRALHTLTDINDGRPLSPAAQQELAQNFGFAGGGSSGGSASGETVILIAPDLVTAQDLAADREGRVTIRDVNAAIGKARK